MVVAMTVTSLYHVL